MQKRVIHEQPGPGVTLKADVALKGDAIVMGLGPKSVWPGFLRRLQLGFDHLVERPHIVGFTLSKSPMNFHRRKELVAADS
jgi:hypothetical protein